MAQANTQGVDSSGVEQSYFTPFLCWLGLGSPVSYARAMGEGWSGRMIRRTEGYLETADGESIWYEAAGEGPSLVLVHGLGGNAAVWYQQVPFFASSHQVITWDQRGFGRSSNRRGSAGPLPAVADQIQLLDHLDVGSAHLVGQSMGGWVVLGAALEAPERVRSLILACTTAGIPAREVSPLEPSEVGPDGGVRPLGVHPAIGDRLPMVDMARAYLYQALGTFGDRPPDGHFARMLSELTYDPVAIDKLDVPVLLICGSADPIMTPARIHDVAGRLTRATVVELPGLGHSPYFEDPDVWNSMVAEFLSSMEKR